MFGEANEAPVLRRGRGRDRRRHEHRLDFGWGFAPIPGRGRCSSSRLRPENFVKRSKELAKKVRRALQAGRRHREVRQGRQDIRGRCEGCIAAAA